MGDLAVVAYDDYSQGSNGALPQYPAKGLSTLVKRDGQWKIAHIIETFPNSYNNTTAEWDINSAGYSFLQSGNVDAALKVFELNTALFPKSANVWDSLGEA